MSLSYLDINISDLFMNPGLPAFYNHLSKWIYSFLVWQVNILKLERQMLGWCQFFSITAPSCSNQQEVSSKNHAINPDHRNLVVDLAKAVEYMNFELEALRTGSESFGNRDDKLHPWVICFFLVARSDCNMFLPFAYVEPNCKSPTAGKQPAKVIIFCSMCSKPSWFYTSC